MIVITNVNNNGVGTSTASNFTDTVSGVGVIPTSTFAGSALGVTLTLDPGSYATTQASAAGYSTTYSSACSGVIAAGNSLTCVITDTSTATSTPNSPSSTLTVIVSGLQATSTAQLTVADLTASTTTATSTGNASIPFVLTTNDHYAVNATTTSPNYSMTTSTGCAGTLTTNATCNIVFTLASSTSTPSSTTPIADLAVSKSVDNSAPHEGDTVHYTILVSALGPATSTGVVATDTLPSGLTFVNATTSVGTYASSTGTWTIGDMSTSSTANLLIAALVNAGTAGRTIFNTAIVGENASTTDNNPTNNSSTVPIVVQSPVCTSGCGGGGSPSSTLTVIVSGLQATSTAQLTVADLTASTTTATSTGNGTTSYVLKTNDSYAVNATTTSPNYSMTTSTGCAGTLTTNATCNIVFTLATSTPTSTPSTDADISVQKTVDNANPAPGATVNYTITVAALGPATSSIVTAQDLLPNGLSLVAATTSIGSYNMSTGAWTIGTLSPNATATLTIAATVGNNEAGQTITNTATVSELSSLVDQNPSNNSSSVSIVVQSPGGGGCTSNCGGGGGVSTAEIGVTKSVDNSTPNPGATIHYTITIQSIGPSSGIGVVATDTLPAGLTFVSASSSAGTYNSGTGTWTLGNVAPNANPTLVITATVNSSDAIGQQITNTATVGESTSVNDPLTGNNTASVTITVGGPGGGGGGGGGGSVGVPGGGGGVIVGGGGNSTSTGPGAVLGASTSCGLYLDQYIHPIRKYLNSSVEVQKLQVFLNQNLGIHLPITGYYGPQTIAAADQFQVKYHIEVLRPWLNYGLPNEYTSTDYVYKTTQRWINLVMCPPLNLPIPQLP